MCGPLVWGFWWIVPLVGVALCLGMMLMAARRAGAGRGCLWLGGRRVMPKDETRGNREPGPSR